MDLHIDKVIRLFLTKALMAVVVYTAAAHNPLTAKMELVAAKDEGAIISVFLSQDGLHGALEHNSQETLSSLDVEAYKRLAVQYVKQHISIHADGTKLVLGQGGIRLGSHQTDLRFAIDNYPASTKVLELNVPAFSENEGHHTAFWWKTAGTRSKVVLSPGNDYQASISLDNSVVREPAAKWWIAVLLAVALVLVIANRYDRSRSSW